MFLRRIELQGFKSFADKTIINFDSNITGIVGPNGCGKSNVNDAIRWVLGEQSAKSLRGGSMSDVIFAGSANRKPVNMAEVTLVFDNTNHNFDIEYEEVEITRRLFRNTGDSEYLINRSPCRLRDITSMVMDSGLGRDSLSVISQGNISDFVESKPEDRRALFEDAAGVSKYKKRKNESLSKLNRTQENLLRVEDIIEELELRVNPLRRQAKKAEQYLALKQCLEAIEISVIVDEVHTYNNQIADLKNKAFDQQSQRAIAETTIGVEEGKNQEARTDMSNLDRELHQLQSDFMKVVNEIGSLEARKSELDEKRRYALEYASNAEKIKEIKSMLDNAEYEYKNRNQRYETELREHALISERLENKRSEYNRIALESNELVGYINRLNNRKAVLEESSRAPFNHQQAVKRVLDVKDSLFGIYGVTSQLLTPLDHYEEAISSALGGAMYHIISEDQDAARHAITYLKKNNGGRATFLPLSVLKEHFISEEDEIVASGIEGYLGIATDFVECEDRFKLVADALLGNVVVCDNLVNGINISKLLKMRYKVVTLDGDIVHKGGTMTGGGKNKEERSPLTITSQLRQVETKLSENNEKLIKINQQLNDLLTTIHKEAEKEEELKMSLAKLEPLVEIKKASYEKLSDEYSQFDDSILDDKANKTDELVIKLSTAYQNKDKIENEMSLKRDRRFKLGSEVEKREARVRDIRRDLNILNNLEKENEVTMAKAETNLENTINRLASNYEMTYEHACTITQTQEDVQSARSEVLKLRNEIAKLGNVNLDAPEEFKSVNERYELLSSQRNELNDAKNKILGAIDEMDEVMIKQFSEMFERINKELDVTFKELFGGGKASLYLSNPEDVLNSGVEVNVQPPGKNINNMKLISGGEKSMLAMCVLFSIMKARTLPLCIFDEVEAALDQSNVERFARYIANFKGGSQFIVVTHRPGTMAQCDALYGVTMQNDGVSRILKVKLNDALDYVDNANNPKLSEVN